MASINPSTESFADTMIQDKVGITSSSGQQKSPPCKTELPNQLPSTTVSSTHPPPAPIGVPDPRPGTHSFAVSGTSFEIDLKYKFIKPIGHGAYGVVMYVNMSCS